MTNASRKPVARKIAAAPAPRRPRRERRAAAARQPVLHLVMPGLEIAQAVPRPRETVTAFLRPTGWGRRDRVYGWQFGKGCRPSLRSTASRADGRHGIGAWRRKGALLSGLWQGLAVDAKLAASSLSLPGRHGFTANVLAREQEDFVDEAIRTALRLIEERIVLLEKISTEAGQAGRTNMAEQFRVHSQDLRERASTLRAVITDMTQVPRR